VTLESFLQEPLDGKPIEQLIKEASGTTGEAMTLKRVACFAAPAGVIGEYRHHNRQVGVLVEITGNGDDAAQTLADEIALHIASADPIAVRTTDIPADLLERERRIAEEQVAQEGKPEAIRARIVEGKVRKFAAERALVEQPFVKDESLTIGALIAKVPGAAVTRFARFKVGEI
jgi:elongation factor Ts